MMVFTPEIDRQIIAGYSGDRKDMLRLLAEGGFSQEVVIKRAEKIGLFRPRPSRSAGPEAPQMVRQCLCCDQVFLAQGHFNRLCRRCRGRG
jgi:hypothetical protein